MNVKYKFLILLFFLSPVLGELLSGSAPPIEFFNPFGFLIITVFYGGSTLLIREAKVRWNLQWSIIFLAISYGILEEGIMMQSFFNFNHGDLNSLVHYGEYFGIHIPWTISLIVYHATISTLIPIKMVELIWPSYKNTPLLKNRSLIIIGTSVTIITSVMMFFIWEQQKDFEIPYEPNPILLIGSLICIILLIALTFYFRNNKISESQIRLLPPWLFSIFGIYFLFGFILLPYILADNNVSSTITISIQIINLIIFLIFTRYQLFNKENTKHHITSFILGCLMVFCVFFSPINEFINGATGMLLVGLTMFILLILWRKHVLKDDN